MDLNQLEQLGEELRAVGHTRRRIVEQIVKEVNEGDVQSSKDLYQELSNVSDHAIGIIDRQKEIINAEMQNM